MADKYDHSSIEPKWQHYWRAKQIFRTPNPGDPDFDHKKPKYYVLGMFPYPSGAGLHVGHPLSYTAVDIIARYKRMLGYNVLNPIGWDSFGLPAEQRAVRTGFPPQPTTLDSINTFRRQLFSLGYSYDWEREIATSDTDYYRWTQWIFTLLFKRGLAYESEAPVWWCEGLGTVLANEEVNEDGLSEIGNYPCVRMNLKQWFLKITEYADRLLYDLDDLEWPEKIKKMQTEWIGRSEGTEVNFKISGSDAYGEMLSVFTTRPDTLYGATYLVLAPDHHLVQRITIQEQTKKVQKYIEATLRKSERARIADTKTKTGVFTGGFAINPVNRKKIPIWIADYILASYGTGAIMAVPAHDIRDFDFATEHNLPIVEVVKIPKGATVSDQEKQRQFKSLGETRCCYTQKGISVNSPLIDGLDTIEAKAKIIDWLECEGLGRKKVQYRLRDWLFSRQRYWGEPIPVIHIDDGSSEIVDESELPITLPEILDFKPTGNPEPPLSRCTSWVNVELPDGRKAKREANVMPQWAGSCWYFIRFIDPNNKEKPWNQNLERYWMPVDMYIGGAEHAVLHLLYSRFWYKVLYDEGYVSTKEPFSILFNQGMVQGQAFKAKSGRILAHKAVRFEGGKAYHPETGEELEPIVCKMSKSVGNVVNPDEIVQKWGADTLRLYLMYLGPLEVDKQWQEQAISGVHRFLHRTWRAFVGAETDNFDTTIRPHLMDTCGSKGDKEIERLLHQTVKKVTEDIERLSFNTALSQMFIFINKVTKNPTLLVRNQALKFLKLLSPFAPHIVEELWLRLGKTELLSFAQWPEYDEDLAITDVVVIAVQVNGKLRGTFEAERGSVKESLIEQAKGLESVQRAVGHKQIIREIVVPDRLLNLVLEGCKD